MSQVKTQRKTMKPNGEVTTVDNDSEASSQESERQESSDMNILTSYNFDNSFIQFSDDVIRVGDAEMRKEDVIIVLLLINLVILWQK